MALSPETYTAGGIAVALIGALITVIRLHDKRIQSIINKHQQEMEKVRGEQVAQTNRVIDALQQDAAAKVQLSRSIDDSQRQQKDNTDKLTEAFYAIIRQNR